MANTDRSNNMVPVMVAKSNAADDADVLLWADPTTHRLLVDAEVTFDGSFTDDAAFTPGTSAVLAVGGMFDDVTPDSVNEGDVGIFRMSANRNLYVTIRDAAGNERGLNIDASGNLSVGSHAVTNVGTFAVQVDGATLTALQLIDDIVYVDDADWTDDTSKHALVGGLYQSAPQTVTDGDVAPFLIDANGRLVVALSATDNTVLDNIDTSLNAIETDAAAIEVLLGTIDADTGGILT